MATPYTHKNLADVKDSAPDFGLEQHFEAHFAKDALDAEEVYVVISGSGRTKLDDEVIDVNRLDSIRVAPGVWRSFSAEPRGARGSSGPAACWSASPRAALRLLRMSSEWPAGWGPLSRRAACLAACVALLGVGAGCGEEDDSAQPDPTTGNPLRLTGEERRALSIYDRRIERHCIRLGRSLVDPESAPSAEQEERAFAAADALIALAAAKPTAPLGAGQDTRLFLADVIENLDGSNCDPAMVSRLEDGLARIGPAQ